jgi:hypothetical protein
LAQKENIEQKFGEAINWDFSNLRKQQYIRTICLIGGLDNEEQWVDIQNDLIERLVRIEKAICPHRTN